MNIYNFLRKNSLVYEYFVYKYACIHVFHYMPDAYRGQNILLDHLKLDFQVVVSLHVGT